MRSPRRGPAGDRHQNRMSFAHRNWLGCWAYGASPVRHSSRAAARATALMRESRTFVLPETYGTLPGRDRAPVGALLRGRRRWRIRGVHVNIEAVIPVTQLEPTGNHAVDYSGVPHEHVITP